MDIVAALEAGEGKRAGEISRAHAEGEKNLLTAQDTAQEGTGKRSNKESYAA